MSIVIQNISGHEDQVRPAWEALWALDQREREVVVRYATEFREAKNTGTRDDQAAVIDRIGASSDGHLIPILSILDHIAHLWLASQFTPDEVIDDLGTLGLLPTDDSSDARVFLRRFLLEWPSDRDD